jgi:hypothetical protein
LSVLIQLTGRLILPQHAQVNGEVVRRVQGAGVVVAERREFRKVTAAAGLGARWVPKELRTSFVGKMSYHGEPVEEIARLAEYASSRTTEVIYRREPRPVITTGAEVMDQIFRPRRDHGNAASAAG